MNKETERLMKISIDKGILLGIKTLIEYAKELNDRGSVDEAVIILAAIELLKELAKQHE